MYDLKSYATQAKNLVLNVPEMEAKVLEATNDDAWCVPSSSSRSSLLPCSEEVVSELPGSLSCYCWDLTSELARAGVIRSKLEGAVDNPATDRPRPSCSPRRPVITPFPRHPSRSATWHVQSEQGRKLVAHAGDRSGVRLRSSSSRSPLASLASARLGRAPTTTPRPAVVVICRPTS